ncbi:terminase subunit 1 [Suid alphaherpesvirus 1]|uniref:Terminase subunit 1 n=1 Tax=Suid herpesvirus 1 (strain Kaplan) TaxID=33703 RepID=G3G8Z9_SUHVK|nr:terminase subunit 1 [Suid alphaherpesvirus 1]AEM64062.1 terminase subunit 1 [Suid alphaherpesvirus 1]AFI70849.1 UL15 [Suid alphaherpesvirus 1]AFI70889.1 UL15 [Suid alphaherpesvirus 1]AFI70958.1 UL15 [Suid alphaherpesvirus 1]AID18756.1 UL15 [Suid alphaherpesvirus 1]
MFGLGDATRRYYADLKRKREASERDCAEEARFFNFAIAAPQRHQTVVPAVGTLHNCCESARIFAGLARAALFGGARGRAAVDPALARAAEALDFAAYDGERLAFHRNAYTSAMAAVDAMRTSGAFRQLRRFVNRFALLSRRSFRDAATAALGTAAAAAGPGDDDGDEEDGGEEEKDERARGGAKGAPGPAPEDAAEEGHDGGGGEGKGGGGRGTLELFQKMILMHAVYFLATVLLGDHAERATAYLLAAFDTPLFSEDAVRHFRQRVTVFLVPRRHGKTWFLVPLIALALATFRGIRVGYTAHIRKATEPVFEEIHARLRRWCRDARVDHVKGENITVTFPDGARSTIVFASSHNTNGIRGQDFNLLFVDEANFIRPDAVQTILGFMNQASCKIIFVSSTNTGKASTSFLTNLRGTDMLNVVTYVCDEHMRRVVAHTDATACSCYVLNKPVFITMDAATRTTAERLLPDSFMQEILGGAVAAREAPVLTRAAGERFLLYRPSSVANRRLLAGTLHVYVDPAFTANARASGTGVAVVGSYRRSWIVLGLEHFFLRALTGASADEIARCVVRCLARVLALHDGAFSAVRVAVEGNSSQDSAVAIVGAMRRELAELRAARVVADPAVVFYHHGAAGAGAVRYPFFLLQKQKTPAFDFFVKQFNSGAVMASQELVSVTVGARADPVEYLNAQLGNLVETASGAGEHRVFTGKRGGCADDLAVALVMAVHLSTLPDGLFA